MICENYKKFQIFAPIDEVVLECSHVYVLSITNLCYVVKVESLQQREYGFQSRNIYYVVLYRNSFLIWSRFRKMRRKCWECRFLNIKIKSVVSLRVTLWIVQKMRKYFCSIWKLLSNPTKKSFTLLPNKWSSAILLCSFTFFLTKINKNINQH